MKEASRTIHKIELGRTASDKAAMIYAVDVGSTLNGRNGVAFAWAKVPLSGGQPNTSIDPVELANSVASDLSSGRSVALGLEAPLFIPVPADVNRLSRGRENEGDRSWAAPAGGYVAALALHQGAWLLARIRAECNKCKCSEFELSVDPARWLSDKGAQLVLFCWEAFVSGEAHKDHRRDAATAAMYFHAHQAELITAVTAENPLSLFGCAVLWSGWSTDLTLLHRSLLVLRPDLPWIGELGVAPAFVQPDVAQ
jgi:hypothetical protein